MIGQHFLEFDSHQTQGDIELYKSEQIYQLDQSISYKGEYLISIGELNKLNIRYVGTSDLYQNKRNFWLDIVFPECKKFAYIDGMTNYFSIAEGDFQVIIFGGNDAVRAASFLKDGKPLLNRRLKISLMTNSMPRRRASALSSGFDDVFDTNRTQPAEAFARVATMWARYQERVDCDRNAAADRAQINLVADYASLTARERLLIQILLSKPGQLVPYILLQSRLSYQIEDLTFSHLKVIVCELRKKIRPYYKIKSRAFIGYELIYSK